MEWWRRGVRVGEALAEARGRAGLTVADVSRRTRIREAIIAGIEADDYSACGGDFYARGNIRSIAQAVGADPEPLICEYDAVHRTPGVLSAVSLDELLTPAHTPRRHRLNWATVLGLAFVAALGFVGYTFLAGSLHTAIAPPAAANHAVTGTGQSRPSQELKPSRVTAALYPAVPVRTPRRPAATVRAYVAAINGHHYARAWRLGGRNAGGSYADFVSGFSGTAKDTLTIVSVSGDVVTARLNAQQTDGTADTYQGTYTVQHGVIIGFDVVQVS
jgi:transcriptional regulator with XRE-family HTH domain